MLRTGDPDAVDYEDTDDEDDDLEDGDEQVNKLCWLSVYGFIVLRLVLSRAPVDTFSFKSEVLWITCFYSVDRTPLH